MFVGSICENIWYGCLMFMDEEVIVVVKVIYVDCFVYVFFEGYDMVFDEDVVNVLVGEC